MIRRSARVSVSTVAGESVCQTGYVRVSAEQQADSGLSIEAPGLLFSPARGLVWFSPVLMLGLVNAVAVWRNPGSRAPDSGGGQMARLVARPDLGYRSIVGAAPFLALLMVPIVERIVASRPPRVVCAVLLASKTSTAAPILLGYATR